MTWKCGRFLWTERACQYPFFNFFVVCTLCLFGESASFQTCLCVCTLSCLNALTQAQHAWGEVLSNWFGNHFSGIFSQATDAPREDEIRSALDEARLGSAGDRTRLQSPGGKSCQEREAKQAFGYHGAQAEVDEWSPTGKKFGGKSSRTSWSWKTRSRRWQMSSSRQVKKGGSSRWKGRWKRRGLGFRTLPESS